MSRFIIFTILSVIFFNFPIFSQTVEKKPELKKFGWSLKQEKKNKKKDKKDNSAASAADDEIDVDVDLVVNDALVIDPAGNFVQGLKKEDFIVLEDGAEQEIEIFSLGNDESVARSVVLIIDYSGSQQPFIKNSVEAAKVLIDKLNPQDRVAVVTDDVKLFVEYTKDKKLLKQKLDLLVGKSKVLKFGKSRQYSALMATLNEMFDEEDLRPIIIFQTDGDESTAMPRTEKDRNNPNLQRETVFTATQLFDAIKKSRATIYSVISGDSYLRLTPEERIEKLKKMPFGAYLDLKVMSENIYKGQASMVEVASASGGFANSLEKPEQADEIYSRILGGITNRYLLGYYPTNQNRDGKQRKVQISIRNHPEYIVQGRKNYYAPEN